MKRKLEADLISIAHRILQLKNKSDINQLYLETQKLYEKLAVLRFVDENFSEVKPTIGFAEISSKIESIFDKPENISEPIVETKEAISEESDNKNGVIEEVTETVIDEIEEIIPVSQEQEEEDIATEETAAEENIKEVAEVTTVEDVTTESEETIEEVEDETFKEEEEPIIPAFEISQIDEVETELAVPQKLEAVQISFEDLLGGNYNDTFFVKKQQVENIPTAIVIDTPKEEAPLQEQKTIEVRTENIEKSEPKTVSLNDKLAKGINIDLNDRLAFIKHLFGNSSEDYNRVLSQLITFDTFYETRDFVQEMVKPDYNNWEGKQEYEERFMDIIEKKFL